jgi:Zn finger protein HypA/HybF involved in hydrogenase expression
MHELSIVTGIVDSVTGSLEFCYEIAAEGTPLEGSRLARQAESVAKRLTNEDGVLIACNALEALCERTR